MWFSGFAVDVLIYSTQLYRKKISLKLLSELWKAGPDRMLALCVAGASALKFYIMNFSLFVNFK